jgi:cbb3-type cytochrome oxidase subunit 3
MIVLRDIPIGEHRLPILYRGYYFDDGSLGGSTGFMETNGGDDLEIIFSLSVTDGNLDCIVTGIATGNAGDKGNIVAETITVTIQNRERYNFIHVTIRANFTGTPWYMPVIGMRSPHVWANNANEIAPYATWTAGASIAATFTVDTDPNMTPDRYPFLIEITAVIQETLEVVTTTIDYRYGVVIDYTGYGPRLQIEAFTAQNIVPGEEFSMTLTIENVGDDTLSDVYVMIATDDTEDYDWYLEQEFKQQFDWSEVFSNWMDVTGPIEIPDGMFYTLEDLDVDNVREIVEINLYMDGVYSKPGARISLIRIIDLIPGGSFNVTYDMFADKDMVNGKPYTIEVFVSGRNSAGTAYSETFDISVMSSLPGKSYNPTELNWFDAGLKALALFLFFIIVLAILMFVYNMFKGEPYDDEDEDFDFEDDEPFEADEPMPVEDAPEAPQQ